MVNGKKALEAIGTLSSQSAAALLAAPATRPRFCREFLFAFLGVTFH